jgi:hypothetical protein
MSDISLQVNKHLQEINSVQEIFISAHEVLEIVLVCACNTCQIH